MFIGLLHEVLDKRMEEGAGYLEKILALSAIQEDIVLRLSRMVAVDRAMWKQSLIQLPSLMAAEMMEALHAEH